MIPCKVCIPKTMSHNKYMFTIMIFVKLVLKIDMNTCLLLRGAGVNRVFVRLDNEPEPTGQRAIVSRLLSPFGNRHFSNWG